MKARFLSELVLALLVCSFWVTALAPAFERTHTRHLVSKILEDARALDGALTRFCAANPTATTVSLAKLLPFLDRDTRVAASSGKDIFGCDYVVGPRISDRIRIPIRTREIFPKELVPESIWAGYE